VFWKVFFLLNNQFHAELISGSKDPFKVQRNGYKQCIFLMLLQYMLFDVEYCAYNWWAHLLQNLNGGEAALADFRFKATPVCLMQGIVSLPMGCLREYSE